MEARARRSDIQAAAVTATPAEVHTGWKRWLESLVNAGGQDIFACRCEQVTCAELIGLQPPRYLNWTSEPMSRRSLRTQLEDGPVNPNQVKRLTRAGTGHCQGRLCREQVSLLLAEESRTDIAEVPLMSYRPPVRPLPLKVMWPRTRRSRCVPTGPSGSALFTKCWGRWDDSARIIGVASCLSTAQT